MTRQQIQTTILEVVRDVQKMSGKSWSGLAEDGKPIGDLEDFDSLLGVEATVLIENKIGCRLDLNSVFVSPDGKRALSLKEIATNIDKELQKRRSESGKRQ